MCRFLEYESDCFVVTLVMDDAVYLLNRKSGAIQRVSKPGNKSRTFQLCTVPGTKNFIFVRDDKLLQVLSTKERKCVVLKETRYESKQSYGAMELVKDRDGGADYVLYVLEH